MKCIYIYVYNDNIENYSCEDIIFLWGHYIRSLDLIVSLKENALYTVEILHFLIQISLLGHQILPLVAQLSQRSLWII